MIYSNDQIVDFEKVGDKYFQIVNTLGIVNTTTITDNLKDNVSMSEDINKGQASINIALNVNYCNARSNQLRVNNLFEYLSSNKITEIQSLVDDYYIDITYRTSDLYGRITGTTTVTAHAGSLVGFVPTDVDKNNNMLYRTIRFLVSDIEVPVGVSYPIGVMKQRTSNRCEIYIDSVRIYQPYLGTEYQRYYHDNCCTTHMCIHPPKWKTTYDYMHLFDHGYLNNHQPSMECAQFKQCSESLTNYTSDKHMIYSSENENIEFSTNYVNFNLRKLVFRLRISLDGFFSASAETSADIVELLKKNGGTIGDNDTCGDCGKVHLPQRPDVCLPPPPLPKPCPCPNPSDTMVYTRTTEDDDNAVMVVSDDYPESVYNPNTMIRFSLVSKDIDDITIGEFVKLVSKNDIIEDGETDIPVVDRTQWIKTIKKIKKVIADSGITYSQSTTEPLEIIDDTTIDMRHDCSGFVSCCLKAYGVLDKDETDLTCVECLYKDSRMGKTSFTYNPFTTWSNLKQGDILVKKNHMEIFDRIENGNNYSYSCGSSKSMSNADSIASGHAIFDVVWSPCEAGEDAIPVEKLDEE